MGLETTTFISGFTTSWPLAGDTKSQGDDHIRLIKATLQSTFPVASKAFYFPTVEAISGTLTLDATDQNNIVTVDTTAGSVTVNLPSTLVAADKGWTCEVIKTSNDANAAIVTPSAGTIATKSGAVATVRVGILCEPTRFIWNGTGWIGAKSGPMIGTVESFDGATTPPGYLDSEGATYSNTAFAELFAVLATTTLRDRRGRADIGSGTGTGLTARVAGTNYGAETHTLTTAELAAHTHVNTLTDLGHTHTTGGITALASNNNNNGGGGGSFAAMASSTASYASGSNVGTPMSITNAAAGSGNAHNNVQPSIGVKKIIRAC